MQRGCNRDVIGVQLRNPYQPTRNPLHHQNATPENPHHQPSHGAERAAPLAGSWNDADVHPTYTMEGRMSDPDERGGRQERGLGA